MVELVQGIFRSELLNLPAEVMFILMSLGRFEDDADGVLFDFFLRR